MSVYSVSIAILVLSFSPTCLAHSGIDELPDFAASVRSVPAARPCPILITAVVAKRSSYFTLSFVLTNTTGASLSLDRNYLPWGARGALALVGVLPDGKTLPYGPRIRDSFAPDPTTLPAGASVRGDFNLPWGYEQSPIPPKTDLLVLWAYPYRAAFSDALPRGLCTGVALIPAQ